jgi:hypothetical protein
MNTITNFSLLELTNTSVSFSHDFLKLIIDTFYIYEDLNIDEEFLLPLKENSINAFIYYFSTDGIDIQLANQIGSSIPKVFLNNESTITNLSETIHHLTISVIQYITFMDLKGISYSNENKDFQNLLLLLLRLDNSILIPYFLMNESLNENQRQFIIDTMIYILGNSLDEDIWNSLISIFKSLNLTAM